MKVLFLRAVFSFQLVSLVVNINLAQDANQAADRVLEDCFSGFGIHASIGISKFSTHSTVNLKNAVLLPSIGVHSRWFLAQQWALNGSLDYLSLGAGNKVTDLEETERLRGLQLNSSAEYFLSRDPTRLVVSVKGGLFVGRILEPILFYHNIQSNQSGQSRPIDTFVNWNSGVILGVAVSRKIVRSHVLSMAFQNDIGLTNTYASTVPEGARALTRAYHLSFSYTFNKH
ncbi:hypothetical protein [Spirosoma endophyticum]|uniref:Outer membrane protein beta-barrel domain-containing protein n=1 Tax=Spirosoma endophyticum TaxID=662367 RepID=A0A1I2HN47_9BACT|nr:hypothetical protein [Spirosoma endophyticum]SFF30720.1 hypothetical protein SAMN05216167_14513 [Spirosoma endophyticum]